MLWCFLALLLKYFSFSLVTQYSLYYFAMSTGVFMFSFVQLYLLSQRNILALYKQHVTLDGQLGRDLISYIVVLVLFSMVFHLLPPGGSVGTWGELSTTTRLGCNIYPYLYWLVSPIYQKVAPLFWKSPWNDRK